MKKQNKIKLFLILLLINFTKTCGEGCLACINQSRCSLCDSFKGYSLNTESKCILTNLENCEFMNVQSNCLLCSQNYYPDRITGLCIALEEEQKIKNCLVQNSISCKKCDNGFFFGTIFCEAVEKIIENCVVYSNKDTCSECSNNTVLDLEGKNCIDIGEENSSDCAMYGFLDCLSCKDGYSLNYSFYILDIVKQDFSTKSLYLMNDVANNILNAQPYPVCQPNNIANCHIYKNSETCDICKENYYLNDNNGCSPYPKDIISNCERYISPSSCYQCKDGFHIDNLNKCIPNEIYLNCDEYDKTSLTTICLKCLNDYYKFSSTKCIERSNKIIEQCSAYSLISDQCEICSEGFITTSDGLKCLKIVENCKSYETSTISNTELICIVCEKEHFLNVVDKKCQKGTTINCLTYNNDSDICVKCVNDAFLNAQKHCIKHKSVKNCIAYSPTEENVCTICDNITLLFQVETICKSAKVINGCETYLAQDECNVCKEKYIKNGKNCSPIDDALNCLIMGDEGCLKCKPGFLIESGECIISLVYLEENCSYSNSVTGKETRNSLKCEYCSENSIPLYYTNYYLCHLNNWISKIINNPIPNCKQIDKINSDYKCRVCSQGFYNNSGECIEQCSPNTLFELSLEEADVAVPGSKNLYSINKTHSCGSVNSDVGFGENVAPNPVTNCDQLSPLVKSGDNENFTSGNRCNKCKASYYPLIDEIGTGKSKDALPIKDINFDINKGLLQNPISFFPVNKNCLEADEPLLEKVENCEYYYFYNNKYRCYKCKHGRTGLLSYKHIASCPESDCLDTFIYGLSSELNGILNCHLCSSGKIPFLFAAGGITEYNSIRNLKAYGPLNTTPGELSDPDEGGNTINCFLKTDPILNLRTFNLPDNCAVAFYNVEADPIIVMNAEDPPVETDRYLSAEDSNKKFNVDKKKIVAFCIVCEKGKRPIKATTSPESETNPVYIPFMIAECENIQNCSNSIWFNYCSECMENFIYEYNPGKGIDYASCVSFNSESNCFAAEKIGNFYKCKMCKRGYSVNKDGSCEILIPPKCIQFEREKKFESFDIKTYLYLNPHGKGCSECKIGFTALKIDQEVKSCTESLYMSSPVFPIDTKFIIKCQKYFLEGNELKCKTCKGGYVLSSNDIECFIENNLDNCKKALTETKCFICFDTHITVDGKCVKKELQNCEKYLQDTFLTKQKCLKCDEEFYLDNEICKLGHITNCSIYHDDPNQCKICKKGYIRVNDKNGLPYCYKYDERVKCKLLDETKFHNGIISCLECEDEDPLFPSNKDIDKNFCSTFSYIEKCLEYDTKFLFNDSAFTCKKCEDDYYSTLDKCEIRKNKDQNCINFDIFQDICTECSENYYVAPNKKTCLPNPLGIPGCRTYLSAKECITCKTKMYLNEKQCIQIKIEEEISNCIYYQNENSCSECRIGYLIGNKICKQALAKNCLTYDSIKQCASCKKDSGLKQEDDEIINCVKNEDDKCVEFNQEIYPFICTTCIQGFFADDEGNCAKASIDIENCLIYKTKDNCLRCEIGFILSPDHKKCINNIHTSPFLDSNCENSILYFEPFCKICKPGFFLNIDKGCDPCSGFGCFLCDSFDNAKCYLCKSGFFMNAEGGCVDSNPVLEVIDEWVGVLGWFFYGGLLMVFW